VVTFAAYAHHPQLPNLVTFGKVYVINNASQQTVAYSERRVFLQNAPFITSITFDNVAGLPNGTYTIRAEIERSDDENLINNSYSRQYTIPFAPITVRANGPIDAALKSAIQATFSGMEREVVFADRTQPGWSFPEKGDVLWLGSIESHGTQARSFVERGNTLYVLPGTGADPLTSVNTALATESEKLAYTSMVRRAQTWHNPQLDLPELSAAQPWTIGATQVDREMASASAMSDMGLFRSRLEAVNQLPDAGLRGRPVGFSASATLNVSGTRLGDLAVVQVMSKQAEPSRPIYTPIQNPADFELAQNYPNPFNPTTTIAYNLPKAAQVSLRVYDLLGREIALLSNTTQAAGRYLATWDGLNNSRETVSSGVYLYRLEALPADGSAPIISTKKMILAR